LENHLLRVKFFVKRDQPGVSMALFSQEQSFLGIDLGAGSVKLVELRNEQGRPRLVSYGMYEVPLAEINDNDWSKKRAQAIEIVKMLKEQTKASTNLVVSALPTFEVFSSLITVPAVATKDLVNAIRLEAKKVVPRPLDEMTFDWKEVGATDIQAKGKAAVDDPSANPPELGVITGSKATEQKKILITAAPKELVNEYVAIFKEAGFRLVGLETEAIALSRSLIGKDPSVVMVADMGAKTTNLSIIEQGIPVVNRGVNFGGIQVTKKIAERMNISQQQVEQWKRDMGLDPRENELSPAIQTILDDLLHEIRYLFQLYRRQFAGGEEMSSSIEKIVFAGGSAFVPGLAQYLAQQLNVPVHLGDPWARIIYPEDLAVPLSEIGPAMAVAVGLAMRQIIQK